MRSVTATSGASIPSSRKTRVTGLNERLPQKMPLSKVARSTERHQAILPGLFSGASRSGDVPVAEKNRTCSPATTVQKALSNEWPSKRLMRVPSGAPRESETFFATSESESRKTDKRREPEKVFDRPESFRTLGSGLSMSNQSAKWVREPVRPTGNGGFTDIGTRTLSRLYHRKNKAG